MIATIVFGILFTIAVCWLIIVLIFFGGRMRIALSALCLIIVCVSFAISMIFGYSHSHSTKKEVIIYLLEKEVTKENIDLAEKYNAEEHRGNNYWCRFALRDEDLIDIDYYLRKDDD